MTGRVLPGSADDGRVDDALGRALASLDGSSAGRARVLSALAGARVFVAVTATATAEHVESGTGLRAESSAEMALLSVVSAKGERAVPAFGDVGSLTAWRADARPVAVSGPYLCRSALDDGAVAVLLDPQGAAVVLAEAEVRALADGYVPVPGSALSFRRTTEVLTAPVELPDPALVEALSVALRPERLRAARLLQGPAGPVLGVCPRRDLDPGALAALAQRVVTRLGAALPAEGLDLAVVPPTGPGLVLAVRRRWH